MPGLRIGGGRGFFRQYRDCDDSASESSADNQIEIESLISITTTETPEQHQNEDPVVSLERSAPRGGSKVQIR